MEIIAELPVLAFLAFLGIAVVRLALGAFGEMPMGRCPTLEEQRRPGSGWSWLVLIALCFLAIEVESRLEPYIWPAAPPAPAHTQPAVRVPPTHQEHRDVILTG